VATISRLFKITGLFYRALMQKRLIILRSLLIVNHPQLKFVPVLCHYGVATLSRLLKIIGLFCRIQSVL